MSFFWAIHSASEKLLRCCLVSCFFRLEPQNGEGTLASKPPDPPDPIWRKAPPSFVLFKSSKRERPGFARGREGYVGANVEGANR